MRDQYIGVQKVVINHGGKQTLILIEMKEHNYHTRLLIDGQLVDRIFPSPQEAYANAAKQLHLSGKDIDLTIDVACNVMDVADVKQVFLDGGTNVTKVVES